MGVAEPTMLVKGYRERRVACADLQYRAGCVVAIFYVFDWPTGISLSLEWRIGGQIFNLVKIFPFLCDNTDTFQIVIIQGEHFAAVEIAGYHSFAFVGQ